MRKGVSYLLTISLVFTISQNAFGWGKKGHIMVADIAFLLLDSNTQVTVNKYLGEMTIEEASVWMDEMRSNHNYDYMKPWHYVNIEKGQEYEATNEENVVNELNKVIRELEHKDRMKPEDIKKDLLILIHLTGDIAQPLHTGYANDKGANDVRVMFLGNNSNLHRVWDSEIIESENISVQDCIASGKKYSKAQLAQMKKTDVIAWVKYSRSQLAAVYDFKDYNIDQPYIDKNKKMLEEDIYIAGLRLATVLEKCFK